MSSALEQIAQLERQIENLKNRSLIELKLKLSEARNRVVELESEIENLTGGGGSEVGNGRKPKTYVTIEQVANAIRKGATNYRQVASVLGCSPLTVANKIEAEGKAAGITSTGTKASFRLLVK